MINLIGFRNNVIALFKENAKFELLKIHHDKFLQVKEQQKTRLRESLF
jgi:hypothetical protein